jgi:LCP family protein required for cell wall assembly
MSSYDLGPESPPRLARSMWKRFLVGMAVIVFLTAAASSSAVLLEVDDSLNNFFEVSTPIEGVQDVLTDVDGGDPQTILILGSDRRWADKKAGLKPRSDTIILVRLDPDKGATAILNVPRDLKVTYKGPRGIYEDKINAAYSIGGPRATVRKVKELMGPGFPIHHVVNVNFGAFSKAVERLGCFYVDIDRRYFNDNQPPVQSRENYAVIDLKPGYQKLCGQDALDYVRFRHLDTDIVRGARQQHFLGAAKDQTGIGKLFGDRDRLLRIFGKYTDTDIRSSSAVLRLLKLAYESSRNPLRRVTFRGELGETFVTITDENLQRTRDEFMNAESTAGAKGPTKPRTTGARKGKRKRPAATVPGLVAAKREGEDQAVVAATKLPFPVYFPKYVVSGGRYWDGFNSSQPRTYDIFDEDKKKHRAYRMVTEAPGLGEYYGIQGTTWKDAPILDNPSETRNVNGRQLLLYRDGTRLRMVAWKTDRAAYWVSNTLLRSLTNQQMLGVARSLTRIGQ